MGVANKAWRCGSGVLVNNLAAEIFQQQKQKLQQSPRNQQLQKQHCWTYRRPAVPWTIVCGLLLFVVGLISLFTGHVASDLEWYSQRLVNRTWYYKRVWKMEFFTLTVCFCVCGIVYLFRDFQVYLQCR